MVSQIGIEDFFGAIVGQAESFTQDATVDQQFLGGSVEVEEMQLRLTLQILPQASVVGLPERQPLFQRQLLTHLQTARDVERMTKTPNQNVTIAQVRFPQRQRQRRSGVFPAGARTRPKI